MPQECARKMISHKYKFIFIHIPKTGGTSIEKIFYHDADKKDVENKHHKFSQIKNDKNYFSFSFVRNPWDLTVSMYNYLWVSEFSFPKSWRNTNPEFAKLSFSDWVTHDYFQTGTIRCIDVPRREGEGLLQYDWIKSDKNIDFIGKFENLQADFNFVCGKIGIKPRKLPHVNNTNHRHYTQYYNKETSEIVAEKYARDIEYFNYEFGK